MLGKLSRRDFLGRAAALGVTAAFANTLLAQRRTRRRAAVKGGMLKAGMQSAARATDSLDPAVWASQVPYFFGTPMGREARSDLARRAGSKPALAEEWGASDDAKVWTFKIRKGVEVPRRQGDDRRTTSSRRWSAIRTRSRNPARSASWSGIENDQGQTATKSCSR